MLNFEPNDSPSRTVKAVPAGSTTVDSDGAGFSPDLTAGFESVPLPAMVESGDEVDPVVALAGVSVVLLELLEHAENMNTVRTNKT